VQIIDCHTHIYPDALAHKAAENIRHFYEIDEVELDGTADALLSLGTAAGIDRFVILPVGMKPEQVRHVNDFSARMAASNSRFIGFGTLHAGMSDLLDETERIISLGLHGIKIHSDFQRFAIDDPRLFPMYEHIKNKLPLLFHMGDPRYDYSHPARLKKVLQQFPDLQVIAAHFGGYSLYETAYSLLKDTNCVFDISSSLMFMDSATACRYINGYGAERMVFGTDFPLWDPPTEVEHFKALDLTDNQFEQIAHKTAERILGL